MQKSEITSIVKQVIELAARNQGWSLSEMTRRLNRSLSTLHRWRQGATVSYDMQILLQIFRWAGVSMDDAFQLQFDTAQTHRSEASALESAEMEVRALTRQLESMRGMINAMSALLGSLEDAAQPSVPGVISNLPGAHASGDRLGRKLAGLQRHAPADGGEIDQRKDKGA